MKKAHSQCDFLILTSTYFKMILCAFALFCLEAVICFLHILVGAWMN